MSASADLYALATYQARAAATVPINEPALIAHWKMAPENWQAHLEAKARLYGRAGDAAKVLEDRPSSR